MTEADADRELLRAEQERLRAERDSLRAERDALAARLEQAAAANPLRRLARAHPALRVPGWLLTGRLGRARLYWAQRRLVRALLARGLFDPEHYRAQLGSPPPGLDLLLHYVHTGRAAGLSPNPLFDPAHVAAQAGVPVADAITHFLAHGGAPNPHFDPGHYAAQVPAAAANPLGHYLAHGDADPNPDFDTTWYRQHHHPGDANPLLHWLATPDRPPTNGRRGEALRQRQRAVLGETLPPGRTAIGIVTYDTPPTLLRRAVRSAVLAAAQAGLAPEILLLDNGGPASAAVLPQAGAEVLPSGGNVGFGAGHNRLMNEAFARGVHHYLALNPDAALHADALGALLRMAAAARGQALVQAIQFPAEHPVAYDPATFDTPWVSGACMLVPRTVHDAIGGFDDGFFMYCEDVDYSWRARAAGLRTLTCPAALLYHPTTGRVLDRAVHRLFLDSALRLALKWGAAAHAAQCRAEMAALGLHPPTLPGIVPVDAPGIADFAHASAFAPSRW